MLSRRSTASGRTIYNIQGTPPSVTYPSYSSLNYDYETKSHLGSPNVLYSPFKLDSPKQQPLRSYTSLVAADALLNLAASPSLNSPSFFFSSSQSTSHTPSSTNLSSLLDPAEDFLLKPFPQTPLQSLFPSSPGAYWNITSSVSPILRTSSPDFLPAQSSPVVQSPSGSASQDAVPSLLEYQRSSARSAASFDNLSPLTNISSAHSSPSVTDSPSTRPLAEKSRRTLTATHLPFGARAKTVTRSRLRHTAFPQSRSRSPEDLAESSLSGSRHHAKLPPAFPEEQAESSNKSTKRPFEDSPNSSQGLKKPRKDVVQDTSERSQDDETGTEQKYPNRTFPSDIPIHEDFPLFYRRFPICSYKSEHAGRGALAGANYNEPLNAFDLYTPRFVKGRGTSKVGLCPCCAESVKRGGQGKKVWLNMKFSAYKCTLLSIVALHLMFSGGISSYHMFYAHGIYKLGQPFSPPTAFRITTQENPGKHEKAQIMQGKCHKCMKWVAVEGIKDVPTKVKEIFWWKHAATCHKGSTLEGEDDVYFEDQVYQAALED